MRYIAVQREAVEELISDRQAQSTEYEPGRHLADVLRGRSTDIAVVSPRVALSSNGNGRILFRPGGTSHTYIVFDLEQSGLFSSDRSDADAVLYFQRLLRFALKYWDQRVFTSSEKVFTQHEKAIIFPHPISQKTNFRISVDLCPDAERLQKRGQTERYLLAYRSGTDDGYGPAEKASVTVFRKFLDDLKSTDIDRVAAPQDAGSIPAFQDVRLPAPQGRMDIHQGYNAWSRALTDPQRRFVEGEFTSPIRIEGPAGTGKTLCLAMKAIYQMHEAEKANAELSAIFVTHSEATRRAIRIVLESMDGDRFLNPSSPRRSLRVETLQALAASILRQELSATEFVDPDAYDAKQMQVLYVEESIQRANREMRSYEKFFSAEFSDFLKSVPEWDLVQMVQHEIAVVIKGRASESFESYKRIGRIPHGLPLQSDGDRAFIWRIYNEYRDQLVAGGQFDTDDVVLTALSQLNTPIWRRRRKQEGYDQIFIDETHLFNMNELSVFHHLTREPTTARIAFAVDRAQAIGDRGWITDIDVEGMLPADAPEDTKVRVGSVFRCSPDIVNLAFSVTSSGANLFTNFEDPLELANSSLSFEEERLCAMPVYRLYPDDTSMLAGAFSRAESIVRDSTTVKGDVVIVAFSEEVFKELADIASNENKPVEILKERGNFETVRRAKQSGRFVLTMPDYVGGLEFDAAILVGIDEGRVPPVGDAMSGESKAFLSFVAHNRMYVSITRARYRVEMLGTIGRGPSPVLSTAIASGALDLEKVA